MSLYVDIKKDFGAFKLDVKFEAENEVFGILGASGCGKSMTLKCIAGVVKPDEGSIVLDGTTLFDSKKGIHLPPQKRQIGMLFQNYALFPHMNVKQNIMVGLPHEKRKMRETMAAEIIEKFYLTGLEKHKSSQLSGGQQQRVALARIFVSTPKILLLDEPFAALDSFLRWELEMELAQRLKEFGGTTLLVSHERNEIHRLCSSVCVIANGKSESVMGIKELFQNPKTYAAAQLSGCKNISKATYLSEHSLFAEDWGVTLDSHKQVPKEIRFVGVRAKDILLAEDETNTIECAIVDRIEELFYHIHMLAPLHTSTPPKKMIRFDIEKHTGALPDDVKTVHIQMKNLLFLT